ncbi:MAG TPA: AI-2E family transporter [Stellaceae bacterium]|nr:AI-2E family transporter [Stellaceae bacterium]
MPDTAPPPVQTDPDAAVAERAPEPRTVFLGGLLALALLAAAYAAAEIVLPIVLAFVLNQVFQPVLRLLLRLGLPRMLAALVIVLALVALFIGFGLLLSGPFTNWIGNLPLMIPKLQEKLHFLSAGVRSLQSALKHIQDLSPGQGNSAVVVQGTSLPQLVLHQVRLLAGGAFTTLLVLFFVLVAGEQFLRRLIDILPGFKEKRQAVNIAREIEHDISVYLATITVMNTLVGIATGAMAWLTGLGDPLLWGTVAFVLNYVPILGPTAGVLIFIVAGVVTIEPLWAAFLPAVLYLLIHLVEGETITPMLLAARFTVNPVLVTIGVIFWYWLWGVVGAVLSTPMLAILKIVCDRIDSLKPVGHFIGGEPVAFAGNGKAAR